MEILIHDMSQSPTFNYFELETLRWFLKRVPDLCYISVVSAYSDKHGLCSNECFLFISRVILEKKVCPSEIMLAFWRLTLSNIIYIYIYKDSVRTSQRVKCTFFRNTIRLVLSEIIGVYWKNRTLWGQNTEVLGFNVVLYVIITTRKGLCQGI